MKSRKVVLFIPLIIFSLASHAMELEVLQRTMSTTAENDEYVVLFRGVHFSKDMDNAVKAAINYTYPEPIDSRYVSLSGDPLSVQERRAAALKKLEEMRKSEPYESLAQTKKKKKQAMLYPSAYHWVMELYVNRYSEFLSQLKNKNSELSKLLLKYQLTFDDIFFVSTSLNCETSIKYGLGLCSKDNKNWPAWRPEEKNKEQIIGFLDVIVIPRAELSSLSAFPVVEEFSLHTIALPYAFQQKDYTTAEEYAFPLSIPAKYHKKRIPLIIKKTRKVTAENFMERFMRGQVTTITKEINKTVATLIQAERGQRIFLYLLRHRFQTKNSKMSPHEAVLLRKKAHSLLIKTYTEVSQKGRSSDQSFTLPESIAIERTLENSNGPFSFQSSDTTASAMHHIVELVKHRNLKHVILGTKKELDEVGAECIGMGSFRYEEPAELNHLLEAAQERTTPIKFVLAFLIDPALVRFLRTIEKDSNGTITFEIDRQNYEAQQYECLEHELFLDQPEHVKAALFPTYYPVEAVMSHFIKKIEKALYAFESELLECEGFCWSDLGCNLFLEDLLIEERNYHDDYTPRNALAFLDAYKKRVDDFFEWEEDDFLQEVEEYLEDKFDSSFSDDENDDSNGAMEQSDSEHDGAYYMEKFDPIYEVEKAKFINKVEHLLAQAEAALGNVEEYESGNDEESDYQASSSSEERSSNGSDSSGESRKRTALTTVESLETERLYSGFILKTKALKNEL